MFGEQTLGALGPRYRTLNLLGMGGMGRVFRALDRLTGQVVALKSVLIPTEHLEIATRTDPQTDFRIALAQEFQLLASLRHPGIIGVLDYGFDNQRQPYLTMELVENAQTIRDAGRDRPLVVQVELLIQLLQALAYLHRRDVVHRDLKPSNVLVKSGQVKVLDFGISIMKGQMTAVSGTLAYMAPEILLGEQTNITADLYAVGVIAYELLTGRRLFRSEVLTKLVDEILNTELDPLLSELEPQTAAILGRLLAKNPQDRFASAAEAIGAFAQIIHQPVVVETGTSRENLLQTTRLVGRDEEVSQLSTSLEQAMAGLGSSWLIGGESGIGKTRLLDELRTVALVNGALVLSGNTVGGANRPYEVWREPLRNLILSSNLDDVEAGILKPIIPDISALLERKTETAPEFDSDATQSRLLTTITNVIKRHEQPMLFLLENIHWADSESLVLLGWLSELATWLPLMIIASFRDDENPNFAAQLPTMQHMKLKRLSERAISELSRTMLGPLGGQQRIVKLLQEETEGNPFFIIEVVRTLAERAGRLDRIGEDELPERIFTGGVRRVVERRLSQVPPEGRPLLQLAAVAGNVLDVPVLKAAMPDADVDKWIADCVNVAVLELRDRQWHFSHDKLRQGILNTLTADQLRELHGRIATAIEQAHVGSGSQAAVLAHHWHEAGWAQKEAYYTALAGEQALRSGAYQTAIPAIERALSLAHEANGHDQTRAERSQSRIRQAYLERLLGEAYYGAGELPKSQEHQEQALRLVGMRVPTSRLGLLLGTSRNAIVQVVHQILPAPFFLTAKAKRAALQEASAIHHQLVQIYYFRGDITRFTYANLRGINLAEASGSVTPDVRALSLANMGVSRGYIPLRSAAERCNQQALAILNRSSDPANQAWVLQLTGIYDVGIGEWARAQERLGKAVEFADRIEHKRRWQESSCLLATVLAYQGDFTRAAQMWDAVAGTARRESTASSKVWVLLFQAQSAVQRGNVSSVLEVLDEVAATLGDSMSRQSAMRARAFRALADLMAENHDLARQGVARALEAAASPTQQVFLLPAYTAIADVCLALWEASAAEGRGDPELKAMTLKAYDILKEASHVFPINQPNVLRVMAGIDWLNGEKDRAQKGWQQSLAAAQRLGMPYEEALARFEIGRHLAAGDPARQQQLHQAGESFTRIGATYQSARANTEMQ
ncbi:MAG TPA: AAA family ATPase [Aggregatilineales bacterium]|nr:AAA family ATPase [Aggregatilineales bacterium]